MSEATASAASPVITLDQIRAWGACIDERRDRIIAHLCPDGIPLTVEAGMALFHAGVDVLWGAVHLLPAARLPDFISFLARQRRPKLTELASLAEGLPPLVAGDTIMTYSQTSTCIDWWGSRIRSYDEPTFTAGYAICQVAKSDHRILCGDDDADTDERRDAIILSAKNTAYAFYVAARLSTLATIGAETQNVDGRALAGLTTSFTNSACVHSAANTAYTDALREQLQWILGAVTAPL